MAFTNVLDPKTEPILDAATRFLWSEDMQESTDAFTRNHVGMFAGAEGPEGEQRLEWTVAHKEFCELFEFRLEQFVGGQGFTQEEFVAACQDALTNGADTWAVRSHLLPNWRLGCSVLPAHFTHCPSVRSS